MCRAVSYQLSAVSWLLAATFMAAQTPDEVQGWLKAVDAARSAFGEAKLRARATQVENGKVLGTADFDIYVKGRDRALIIFRGGRNDGRKALTVGQKMWLIVPGAEHPVPITQNQRLMGGASFADVASLRFAEDFDPSLRPGTETVGERVCRVIDLTAKAPGAAYPKATLWLDAEEPRLPRRIVFAFSSGKPAREVTFTKFRPVRGRTVVAEMEIRELIGSKTNVLTRLEYLEIQPAKIDDSIFTPDGARAM
ncbi:MAG: outer membrane lipoprotein-sorting protein [Thermoanaerobaculia bacterium]